MTIRDSAEESAAAEGDVLELCKMVNDAFLPLGIAGSCSDGNGSCQVMTETYHTSSYCVAPFPVMATVGNIAGYQHRRVSVTVGSKIIKLLHPACSHR